MKIKLYTRLYSGWKTVSAILVLSLTIGCEDFVNIDGPPNQVLSEDVFTSEADARAAMDGIYSKIMQSNAILLNGGLSLYGGLSSDEIINTNSSTEIDPIAANAIDLNNRLIQNNLWRLGYIHIYHINACLEGIAASTSLQQTTIEPIRGEALFLRALTYFYMVNLFENIPLVLSTDYRVNALLPQSSKAEVYEQIKTDLNEARSLLKVSAPQDQGTHANYWSATALLSRVELYSQEWLNAKLFASEVIESGFYELETDLNAVFLNSSTEIIFQIIPVTPSGNSSEGASFIPVNDTRMPSYLIRENLVNSLSEMDHRFDSWIKKTTINEVDYYYPYKYKVRSSATAKEEYNVVIRLAELFLIRAEAQLQLNDTGTAIQDLNKIRERAGLLPLSEEVDLPNLFDFLTEERQKELFAEWGHRWLDLKRTDLAGTILEPLKPDWQATDVLYPIPQQEIDSNPNLTQNPGY